MRAHVLQRRNEASVFNPHSRLSVKFSWEIGRMVKKKKDERVNGWHLERNLIQLTSDRVHYVIIFIERVSKEGQSSLDDVIINLNLKYWKKMRKWRGSCNNLKKYKFFPHRINLDCDLFSTRCLFLQVLPQSSMTLYDRISPSVSPVFTVFYQ